MILETEKHAMRLLPLGGPLAPAIKSRAIIREYFLSQLSESSSSKNNGCGYLAPG